MNMIEASRDPWRAGRQLKLGSIFKVLGSIAILAISPPLVSQTKAGGV